MTITDHEFVDLKTPAGPMRTHIFRPAGEGKFPGIALYSEIFQVNGPIRRTAAALAGHGFLVAAPEIFHELLPPGTVLGFDTASSERGNACKTQKTVAAFDADLAAMRDVLKSHAACNGRTGSMGFCIGGHLSMRNAFSPDTGAAACVYATDIHKLESHPRGLGPGMADDTLERIRSGDVKAELLMAWGRQDPHIPFEARMQIRHALEQGGANHQSFEVNAAHAFMRDEGPRCNPVLAQQCFALVVELFKRRLA
jgi:carboxymethylenebutenolidase